MRGAVGGDEVIHQLQHLLLGRRREVPLDVASPNILTDQRLRQPHATLPTVALLRRAAELVAVELEVGLADLLGQHPGTGTQDVPGGPQLPVRQRFPAQHRVQVGGVGRHHVDDLAGQAGGVEKRPHKRRHLLERGRVVGGHRVARFDHIPVARGQLSFQVHDALRGDLGGQTQQVLRLEEAEHGGHVLPVVGEGLRVVLLAVVGLVRQAQAGLDDVGHGIFAVGILLHPKRHRAADAHALQLAQVAGELLRVRNLDLGQILVDGADAGGVDALDVHEGLEQVAAETLAVLEDGAHIRLGLVAQDVKRAVDAAVRGNLVGCHPLAVYKLKEVIHAPTLHPARGSGPALQTAR